MKKLTSKNHKGFAVVESILILVIVGILGGVGWYVWNAHNKTTGNFNNADLANSSVAKYPKKQSTSDTSSTTSNSQSSPRLEKTKTDIEAAMNSKDYAAIEADMEDTVGYSRVGSDAGGQASKTEVIQQFNYFGPPPGGVNAQSPWNFNDKDFHAKLGSTFDNAYVGVSKDKDSFIAFTFDDSGLISSFEYGFTKLI